MNNMKLGDNVSFVILNRRKKTWWEKFTDKIPMDFTMQVIDGRVMFFDDNTVIVESEGKMYYKKPIGLFTTRYQAIEFINSTFQTNI